MKKFNYTQQIEDYLKKIKAVYTKNTIKGITNTEETVFNFKNEYTNGYITVEAEERVYCNISRDTENYYTDYYESDWDIKERSLEDEIDDFISRAKEIDIALKEIISIQEKIKEICEQYDLNYNDYIFPIK